MMLFGRSLVFLGLAQLIHAYPSHNLERATSCGTTVDGVGVFMVSKTYDFTSATGTGLAAVPTDLWVSTDLIEDTKVPGSQAPYNHQFEAKNVVGGHGFLQLIVPGGQDPNSNVNKTISSAELATVEHNILYGSVRTKASLSPVVGTCQAFFFYKNDTQDNNIEYLSDPAALPNNGSPKLHYTNHGPNVYTASAPPPAHLLDVHEYRTDWVQGYTAYYIDGVLQANISGEGNVPTVPGTWLWNNWANGDEQWAVGPPPTDSVLKIQSIVMYYNTTESPTTCS